MGYNNQVEEEHAGVDANANANEDEGVDGLARKRTRVQVDEKMQVQPMRGKPTVKKMTVTKKGVNAKGAKGKKGGKGANVNAKGGKGGKGEKGKEVI